jgi:WD40 repeat protein
VVTGLTGLTGSVWPVAFSPDGQLVLTSFEYNSARLWETATGKPVAILIGHTHRIASATFSPDAKAGSNRFLRWHGASLGNRARQSYIHSVGA